MTTRAKFPSAKKRRMQGALQRLSIVKSDSKMSEQERNKRALVLMERINAIQ